MLEINNLNSFLKLGYFLNYKNEEYDFDFSIIDKEKYQDLRESELLEIGSRLLLNSVNKRFIENKNHIVPISGGLDSRAILSGLLQCTEAKNIETYTFGTPGTLDYDIGNYVAKKLGTNHSSFPLTDYRYSLDDLLDVSKRINQQTVLFHHAPVQEIEKKYGEAIIWSGFMGDPLAGSHLSNIEFSTVQEEKRVFVHENTYVKSTNLMNDSEECFYDLIDYTLNDNRQVTLKEEIDFINRQLKFVAPHVLMKGFEYEKPFLDKDWQEFILSVDNKYRLNQNLYNKILLRTFPQEFSLKTKNNFGLPLSANKSRVLAKRVSNKMKRMLPGRNINTNYLDFNYAIRNRNDLKHIVYENIMDLKNRKVVDWIDIDNIWSNHINKKYNHADALIVLTSLEIHLKAREMIK